ncbi:unknown [Collinsella sp. CAG:289]|nr:unknown [Collinsella sp. CAG:289]
MPRRIEIEHLKRRDAQGHAYTSRNLRRLGNIAIKRLVKRTYGGGHAQGKGQSKCLVARIGQRSCRSRQDVANKAPTILGFNQCTMRAATRR